MYKKFILLFSVAILSCGFIFSENITEENDAAIVAPNIDISVADKLNNTSMRFCIDGTEPEKLSRVGKLTSRPWETKDICMVFINNLPTKEDFIVGFSQWQKDNQWNVTCDQDMSDNDFLKLIRIPEPTRSVTIDSGSNSLSSFKITIPKTYTGNIYGCVAYYMSDSYSKKEGEVFWLLVRKIAPIEISITWDVYNYGRRDDIKYTYTENKQLILKILIAILAVRLIVSIVKTNKKKEPKSKK